jgi:hypothetical protein
MTELIKAHRAEPPYRRKRQVDLADQSAARRFMPACRHPCPQLLRYESPIEPGKVTGQDDLARYTVARGGRLDQTIYFDDGDAIA